MQIECLDGCFSVCKVEDYPPEILSRPFCFTGRTDAENSLVCRTEDVPARWIAREDGWRAFRVQGTLDFSLTGVLAGISARLAEQGIGIFVVSTYNTDYVFVKEAALEAALAALSAAGYGIAGDC